MIRLPLVVVALLLLSTAFARADFGTDLEVAEQQSKATGKLVLVYIWSPQCHVCRGLNEKIWPQPVVQQELGEWSAVKIDSESAVRCKYRWKIDDVPQLRVLDPEGNEFKSLTRNDVPGADHPEKFAQALAAVRQEWAQELASRRFEWVESVNEARAQARVRGRPIAWFAWDGAVPRAELNAKFAQFTDKVAALPSKRFVCVPLTRDMTDVWPKLKPVDLPGFIFTDPEGGELRRCSLKAADELAGEFTAAVEKFDAANLANPGKVLDRMLATWDAALKSDHEADKLDAAQRLIDSKEPKVVKPLARGLADPSAKLRERLIPALTAIDATAGLPELIRWAQKEPDAKWAVKAWDAVGATGDLRAVPALEADLLDTQAKEIVVAKIRALGNMKDKAVIEFLVDLPLRFKGKGGGKGAGKAGGDKGEDKKAGDKAGGDKGADKGGEKAPDKGGDGGGGGQRAAVHQALKKLTRQDFGEDWLAWKKWWRDNDKTFKFEADPPATK